MKILWVVNTIFPIPAKKMGVDDTVFGGWLKSMFEDIIKFKDISKIAVVTVYNGKLFKKYDNGKEVYYLIPNKNLSNYNNKTKEYWQRIISEFDPDLIHIHGTEYPHALPIFKIFSKPTVITSIQGLVSICGQKEIYNASIPTSDLLKNITFRDILKNDLLINQHKKFLKRGFYEKEIIKKSNYVIGRTKWDKEETFKINSKVKYFVNNENLRSTFYSNSWDVSKINRHAIFVSQATYPIKGFHTIIKSIKELTYKYSDLKVFVAGPNIIKSKTLIDKLKLSGYGLYLKRLIKKYNLEKTIEFLGSLNEKEIVKYLLKCNVFVQTSSIENSPNSLGEAMILGMPIVASNVGGTNSMLKDKKEGLLYEFGDTNKFKEYISSIFEDDEFAKKLGTNARKRALETHNREKNAKELLQIYKKVLKK